MLQIFALNFFPQMSERLIIVNLAMLIEKENVEDQILHTYDYLNFVIRKYKFYDLHSRIVILILPYLLSHYHLHQYLHSRIVILIQYYE